MVDVDARLAEIAARAEKWDTASLLAAAYAEDVSWLLAVLKEQAGQIERLQREATADAVARDGGELNENGHVCLTTENTWRPCPESLCEAGDLLGVTYGLAEELAARRVCLVAARDDLASIRAAAVEDGGIWLRAVAARRIELVEEAIASTDAALLAGGMTDTAATSELGSLPAPVASASEASRLTERDAELAEAREDCDKWQRLALDANGKLAVALGHENALEAVVTQLRAERDAWRLIAGEALAGVVPPGQET